MYILCSVRIWTWNNEMEVVERSTELWWPISIISRAFRLFQLDHSQLILRRLFWWEVTNIVGAQFIVLYMWWLKQGKVQPCHTHTPICHYLLLRQQTLDILFCNLWLCSWPPGYCCLWQISVHKKFCEARRFCDLQNVVYPTKMSSVKII